LVQEASADTVDIQEGDLELFQAMMRFFYEMHLATEAPVINNSGIPLSDNRMIIVMQLDD
jgi:hypothetical protein